MPFDTLTPRLKYVAGKAVSYCRKQYGGNSLKTNVEISPVISWRPTFYLKPTKSLIIAVEVEDNLYPEALKGAAHDIGHFDFPIAVYQACSLDVFQKDPGQKKVNALRHHGFGIITVDDDGTVTTQCSCIPLAQHISPVALDSALTGLNPSLKPKFRTAYTTYLTNEGQGLQQAGQIVEGLVLSITTQAEKNKLVINGTTNKPQAAMIDALYALKQFEQHRAALGAARGFVKEFRNTASHVPKNAKQAADKIKKCRTGFLDAISVATKLRVVMQALGYKVKIYTA